jgi:hypothetical protein
MYPLGHADDAESSCGPFRSRIETAATVLDCEENRIVLFSYYNRGARRTRMLSDVPQRFLDDSIDAYCNARRELLTCWIEVESYGQACALLPKSTLLIERSSQTMAMQDNRV